MDASSEPDRNRQDGVLAGPGGSLLRAQDFGGHARWIGRGYDRRQDAGRCDLETGARDGRSRPAGGGGRSALCVALPVLTDFGAAAPANGPLFAPTSQSCTKRLVGKY